MIERKLTDKILRYLKMFRIVYLTGARQVGKSTLIKYIADKINAPYVNFDYEQTRISAQSMPESFLRLYTPPVVIDEVQKVPEVIDYLKIFVDNIPKPGQYIITGSSNLFNNPKIYESLSGRVGILQLFPLATSELIDREFNLVEVLFRDDFYKFFSPVENNNLSIVAQQICRGRYPELIVNPEIDPHAWFESYIHTRLKRDLRDLNVKTLHKQDLIETLLALTANQIGSLQNVAHLAKELKVNYATAKNYLFYLENLFLIHKLRPFYRNLGKQVLKAHKIYLIDTGLACFFQGHTPQSIINFPSTLGHLLENFIYLELLKEISFSQEIFHIYFYRDDKKNEVDFIIENRAKEIIAIELKLASVVRPNDLAGLRSFLNKYGQVKQAYVIYGGKEINVLQVAGKTVYLLPMWLFFE